MTTSGTYAFTVNTADIVREMMLNVGAIGEAEVPTAQEYTDCVRKLNLLAKQWMGRQDFAPGLKMWTRQRSDLLLSSTKYRYALGPTGDQWAAGVAASPNANHATQTLITSAAAGATTLSFGVGNTGNFTPQDYLVVQLDSGDIYSTTVTSVNAALGTIAIPPLPSSSSANAYVWNYTTKGQRPLNILTCVLRDIYNNDTPLNPMTLEDYELLPTKTMPGYLSDPSAYYYESQIGASTAGNGQLYLDVTGAQDVTKHLHLVYLRPVMDLVNATDTPDYPQQWYRALVWGGSREICGMFDAIWTEDMQANYLEAVAMAREADSDTTTFYFQPNSASPYDP